MAVWIGRVWTLAVVVRPIGSAMSPGLAESILNKWRLAQTRWHRAAFNSLEKKRKRAVVVGGG